MRLTAFALLVLVASVSAWDYYYSTWESAGVSNHQYYSSSGVAITPIVQQAAYQPYYYGYYWQPVNYRARPYWVYSTCWDSRWGFGNWYCNDHA
ncbi:MAG: hypothetical protein V1881_02005 [Candidatus Micrarchaeota archaeon]